MRIVLDLQGAQAENRRRGIGRYSLSLATAIVREARNHEVLIALNGAFTESVESVRAAFDGLLPQGNVRVFHTVGSVAGKEPRNDVRRHAAELVREAFLASLEPDVVHVSSLFEGFVDDAVTSIGAFTSTLPTVATLYDLIPYVYRDIYLADSTAERWYQGKLNHLRRADRLVAISESSRSEAVEKLGLANSSVINISTAAEGCFRPRQLDDEAAAKVRAKYGLSRPFIMYTGGIDPRKNLEGLIEAYAGLPQSLRQTHQLAIVCAVQPQSKSKLERLSRLHGLGSDEVVVTGFVPELDLVALYGLCKLFVFPSWHEGFGLPALEAMHCGAAVIGANTSSLPEVIAREDALFDPRSPESICSKMQQVLVDDELRAELSCHGLRRAAEFSWDTTAQRTVAVFEELHAERLSVGISKTLSHRPTLAYVSPLPPQRSGIAGYSAGLLPELARYYEIVVIVQEGKTSDPWINANCLVHTPVWLTLHAHEIDRVLYHFGNSEFHAHMFELIETVPGTVVLHDFFLSGVQAYREARKICPYAWTRALYHSHGYRALRERYLTPDSEDVAWRYPANLSVLQWAQGVIVHSESTRRLAADWYGATLPSDWQVIPLLRVATDMVDKRAAREQLGLPEDGFIVCSFGLLGPTKLNHRLLSAWLASSLARNPRCMLLFVGENHDGEYGRSLVQQVRANGDDNRVRIVGWTDTEMFHRYLAAADVGVQLRTLSRGETSGAVLDCLNYGLATIVNANGSMADIRDDSVWKLPDVFTENDLVVALQTLADDPELCRRLGQQGRRLIEECHDPRHCADSYHAAVESFWAKGRIGLAGLLGALSDDEFAEQGEEATLAISTAIATNCRPPGTKQLFLDISELVQRDWQSGIQRVVKNILKELIESPPEGFRVEPVFATRDRIGYFYARSFTSRLLGCPESWATDCLVDAYPGDVFLGIDLQPFVVPAQKPYLDDLRNRGVEVCFVVYDLLPVSHPECFVENAASDYTKWLNTIDQYDRVIAISKAVADEVVDWLDQNGSQRFRPLKIDWFHLGVDDVEVGSDAERAPNGGFKRKLPPGPTFLMVGTLEPRKCHSLVLDAFELLWADGVDANLIIVGKKGWLTDGLVTRLSTHSQNGKHLFWEAQADDERLEQIYSVSHCLIAASVAEGFGLPLVEAARHGLAILARDIPVFREVAGNGAFYFKAHTSAELAQSVRAWLALYLQGLHPNSEEIAWLTWAQSAKCLEQAIFRQKSYASWMPVRLCPMQESGLQATGR